MATETPQNYPVDPSLVSKPNDLDSLPNLLQAVTTGVNALTTGQEIDRQKLLLTCRTLIQAIETPRETMIRHCWAETGVLAALNFGVDSGLWKLMAENGDKSQTVTDLAASLRVDPILLSRFLRHLAAMGYITETGEGEYKPTNYINAMSLPIIGNGYLAMPACTGAGPLRFHEFSRKRGWKNPTDAKDTSMMYAYGTDKDMFAWQQHLGYGTHFNDHMGGYRYGRVPWMAPDFYPVKERLIDGADTNPNAPFLVDIGGSVGHDLVEFKHFHPNAPGKLILQDLPVVISQIQDLDPEIRRMEHDFLTEQPIKGARAYYMHSVLHDWPDDTCLTILTKIKDAMKPSYSKLLINENVITQKGAHWEATALDMVMLTLFSSKERTQDDWYNLIEKMAGLKIIKIWSSGKGVESLIECELA